MNTNHQSLSTKHQVGLVIGRFQPFHLGHKYLIEQALNFSEKLIIGIGSSNISDDRNPYPFGLRKKILTEFIKQENLGDRIVSVLSVLDHPDDDVWLNKLLIKTGKVDAVIGDNEWVNGIFENIQTPVVRIGFHDRERLEGKVIRKLMHQNKEWKDRTPEYLVSLLEK